MVSYSTVDGTCYGLSQGDIVVASVIGSCDGYQRMSGKLTNFKSPRSTIIMEVMPVSDATVGMWYCIPNIIAWYLNNKYHTRIQDMAMSFRRDEKWLWLSSGNLSATPYPQGGPVTVVKTFWKGKSEFFVSSLSILERLQTSTSCSELISFNYRYYAWNEEIDWTFSAVGDMPRLIKVREV